MHTDSRIEIHFSKKKTIFTLIISILFVFASIWIVSDPPNEVNPMHGVPKIVGCFSILFFGLVAVFSSKKMFDKHPAIILDSLGLEDKSSVFPAGFILWQDLKAVSIRKVKKQRFIMLHLKDPKIFIENQPNFFRSFFLKVNDKIYGGQFVISTTALNISIEELFELLKNRIEIN